MPEPYPLSDSERKEWKRKLLKNYLRNFLCPPLPEDQQTNLSNHFRSSRDKVTVVVTPTEMAMKQAGACYLLSFGKEMSWTAVSSYELVKSFLEVQGSLSDLMSYDLVIIYHGFDSLPNKMISGAVAQVAFSRAARNLKTLVLERSPDASIPYTFITVESSFASVPQSKLAGRKPAADRVSVGTTPKGAML